MVSSVAQADIWECVDRERGTKTITACPVQGQNTKCLPLALDHVPYNKLSDEQFVGFLNGIKEQKEKLIFEREQKDAMTSGVSTKQN